MKLVDTSAFVEWLSGSPTGKAFSPLIPVREDWLVPTIVQLELAKWLAREMDQDTADRIIAFTQKCVIVHLDTAIALLATDMCGKHKLATADAVIYATAVEYGAELLTCDAHFDGLPGVVLVRKILN